MSLTFLTTIKQTNTITDTERNYIMFVPHVIEESKHGDRAYDPYSRLLKDRIVFLSGEINQDSADLICAELLFLDAQEEKEIKLYIDSPGGSVTAGFAIYDTMRLIKSKVSTTGIGLCASMGAFLLSSGEPGMRNAAENCEIMIHQPLIAGGGISGQTSDISIEAKHMERMKEHLLKLMANQCDCTYEEMVELTDRNNWLTADEASNIGNKGLIDHVI